MGHPVAHLELSTLRVDLVILSESQLNTDAKQIIPSYSGVIHDAAAPMESGLDSLLFVIDVIKHNFKFIRLSL